MSKTDDVREITDVMHRQLSFLEISAEGMTDGDIQMLKNVSKRLNFLYRVVYWGELMESEADKAGDWQ